MAKIYRSAEELIGETPLLELTHLEQTLGLQAGLLAKLESFNPGGGGCHDRRRRGTGDLKAGSGDH